ncbi:MAG TPA: hypothetical protein DCQ83_03200 [Fibrobacteres bacterium]|jgi:TonB family protein|nr:hypothetical protein [Fibrobacterota bacterium]
MRVIPLALLLAFGIHFAHSASKHPLVHRAAPTNHPKTALADSSAIMKMDTVRTAESTHATVTENAPALSRLRRSLLKSHPGLHGMVRLRLGIASSGVVTEPKILSSTTGVPEFDTAVLDTVSHWRFKPVEKPGTVTLVVPFNFPSLDSLKSTGDSTKH